METMEHLTILKKLFRLYDDFMADINVACNKGCTPCCTCNVTCTTLEGFLIYHDLMRRQKLGELDAKVLAAPAGRFQPAITLNQMVEMCVHDLKIPEETNEPGAGHCQWLDEALCSFYTVRPFACRAMCSLQNCAISGEAQMPPLVLTVNHVFMQYVEALDRPGASGNLMDVLHFLSSRKNRQAYMEGSISQFPAPLRPNLPFSVLMVPPEHHEQIATLRQTIQQTTK